MKPAGSLATSPLNFSERAVCDVLESPETVGKNSNKVRASDFTGFNG